MACGTKILSLPVCHLSADRAQLGGVASILLLLRPGDGRLTPSRRGASGPAQASSPSAFLLDMQPGRAYIGAGPSATDHHEVPHVQAPNGPGPGCLSLRDGRPVVG